ncbi:hypothetical protein WICPIJ_004661, partial [Wickerhamomyces pijperi]
YKPIEWVKLNDNNHQLNIDLYIKQPQIFDLIQTVPYNFQLTCSNRDLKCNLVSPSGSFHLLQYKNGAYELVKRLKEPGLWRLVVQKKDSLHVYAEWKCS